MWFTTKIQPIWQKLQPAQQGYACATLCVLLWLISFGTQVWLLYGMALALLVAVTLDMWHGFLRIWNSLAGKAVIIVFYAILGNFCFALAESQVNSLIGIRPDVVPYTVNLALFLLAPIWSFGLSLAALTLYTTLHAGKIALLLILRPLGVRSHHILGDEAYPVKTLIARIIYLPVFMSCLAVLPGVYVSGDSRPFETMFNGEPTTLTISSTDETSPASNDSSTGTTPSHAAKELQFNPSNGMPSVPWLNRTLARFLYRFESLGRSSCKMSGKEHVVHINDYEVLVITPDNKAETGYQYQVRLCGSVGYSQPSSPPPQL